VVIATGFVEIVRAWWSERAALLDTGDALNVFLILWLIVPMLFLFPSQSKLPGYILPALPAGTLLAADTCASILKTRGRRPCGWLDYTL